MIKYRSGNPMNESLKNKMDAISDDLWKVIQNLEAIYPELKYNMDKKAVVDILADLKWAVENCTTVGLHQIEEALDDNMGTGLSD